ncbi:uncharacterized protein LOC143527142 isoform X2 [Brachyhypopomus gauderio]|uniref:uncharacterized protein LOC143527142 isoform X2 n=1 Tax=Brachyhypopomus gauderio TaxID=698409 RepID=UPI004041AB48
MLRRRSSSNGAKVPRKRRSSSVGFDEFGFAFSKKEKKLQHRCHDYSYPQPSAVKVKELCELLSYWNGSSFLCKSQIERFIRIGIPPALRGRVWTRLLNVEAVRMSSDFSYQVCLAEIRAPLMDAGVSEYGLISAITAPSGRATGVGPELTDAGLLTQIALDLQRSFPTHRSLMGDSPEAIEGQAKLFRVLTAYAKYNPRIGYSQGMSYIAAVFLMILDEEEAFWAMVVLLEKPKYLSEIYESSLKKIQHQALVFQQLLKHRKPQLYQHMEKLGVSSLHFIMQWFLTLFTSLPCWDSVLAIWDLFLLHGVTVVFRVGLAILQLMESRLLSVTEEAAVLPVLLRVPVDVSRYCVLVPALWSIEVQEWEINCMNSLILEETAEEQSARSPVKSSADPQCTEETQDQKPAVETPAHIPPCEKEAVGPGGKNVFSRLLKVAQRYLAETAKHNGAAKHKAAPNHNPESEHSTAANHNPETKHSTAANHNPETKHSTAANHNPETKHSTAANHNPETKHSTATSHNPETKHSATVKARASGKNRPKERIPSSLSQTQKRRSQRRQSQHAVVGVARKEPLPLQDTDGGAAEGSGWICC